jgi:hypothetical protein
MFQDLLRTNGVIDEIRKDLLSYLIYKNEDGDIIDLYIYKLNEIMGSGTTIAKAFENFCMQYCIENGVKLEWIIGLNEKMYFHNGNKICWRHDLDKPQLGTFAMIKDGLLENVSMYYGKDDENYVYITKLIAAIFAHDIKIIAT